VTPFRRNLDFCLYGRTSLPQADGSTHRNAGTVNYVPSYTLSHPEDHRLTTILDPTYTDQMWRC